MMLSLPLFSDDADIITKGVPMAFWKKYMSKCQFFHDKGPRIVT